MSHHRSIFYCLFLAGPGGGPAVWWARGVPGCRGRGLGARIPANPCSSVPFAPSLRTFSIRGRRGLGAQIPAKPLFFRPLCTKSPDISGPRPPGIWCTNPRTPLFFRPLCTKSSDIFGPRPPRTWCTDPRKTLVLPSPLHQISGHFRPAAAVTFSKSKVDKCAIMLYHSICQLLQQTS